MQTIRSGSSIGNEVARRLNACEEKNLQKEVSRFEKEHEKRMREFFNERYAVRQVMRGFKIDNVKSALHKGSRAQKNDIEKIKPNSLQAWRVPLEQNDISIVNSSAKIKNLKVPKRQRKLGLIRSSSVPNLYQPACVATSKETSHDKEHDPGTNNTNAIARQRVSKPCQWMTVGELNDKKESMEKGFENTDLSFPDSVYQTKSTPQQSINGYASFMNDVSNVKRGARHKRPKTSLPTRCQMYKEINTADGFFEDKSIQRILSPTEKKRTKSDVTPFLDVDKSREQGSNCDSRPKTSLRVRYHHQKENILSQQKQQHGNVKTSLTFHVSKDAHNSINNHRPLSSCSLSKVNVSSVKFLTVSETVIATQKLIKSYRRQQAIEKATQEIKSKQKTSNSTKADSAQTLQAKPKFKGVVNAVMAVNAFKRNLKIIQK